MSDLDIIEEIVRYAPSATFTIEMDRCIKADFTSSDETFIGSFRTLPRIEKEYVLHLINKLKSLKSLNLRKNRLSFVPEMDLPNIEHLDLASNYMCEVPEWIKSCNLSYLNLGVNNLESIPDWISEFKELKVLKIHKNKLTNVDPIFGCKKLQFLNLYLNQIQEIPNFIFSLPDIEFFSWGLSKITELSDEICKWKKLKWLSLVANKLRYLPDGICTLQNLQALRVHKNNLCKLPENIGDLQNLEQISLYSNNLKSLPESFRKLKLKKCNLAYNEFEEKLDVVSDWLCVNPEDCKWTE